MAEQDNLLKCKQLLENFLIQEELNVNAQDDKGYAAVHYACQHGNVEFVSLLIASYARLDVLTKSKQSPLLLAHRLL